MREEVGIRDSVEHGVGVHQYVAEQGVVVVREDLVLALRIRDLWGKRDEEVKGEEGLERCCGRR